MIERELLHRAVRRGSLEARRKMAYLRSLRRGKRGGSLLATAIGTGAKLIGNWITGTAKNLRALREERDKLRRMKREKELRKKMAMQNPPAMTGMGRLIKNDGPTYRYVNSLPSFEHTNPMPLIDRMKRLRERRKRREDLLKRRQETMENIIPPINGGKFEGRDILDFLAGPSGWIAMGIRKKRQREIEQLQRDLAQ